MSGPAGWPPRRGEAVGPVRLLNPLQPGWRVARNSLASTSLAMRAPRHGLVSSVRLIRWDHQPRSRHEPFSTAANDGSGAQPPTGLPRPEFVKSGPQLLGINAPRNQLSNTGRDN